VFELGLTDIAIGGYLGDNACREKKKRQQERIEGRKGVKQVPCFVLQGFVAGGYNGLGEQWTTISDST